MRDDGKTERYIRRHNIEDKEIVEANQASSTWRISGELGMLQPSVVRHLDDLGKRIQSWLIVRHVTKILQNLWLTLVILIN